MRFLLPLTPTERMGTSFEFVQSQRHYLNDLKATYAKLRAVGIDQRAIEACRLELASLGVRQS